MTQVIVLFLVGIGEAHARPTLAMQHAVSAVLGLPGSVVVAEAPPDLSDAGAIEQERALHATAVVRLSWVDADRSHVELRVHRDGAHDDGAWISRVIGFDSRDAPDEVGRTIGYTVLAMLPSLGLHAAVAPTPEAPPTPTPTPPAPDRDVAPRAASARYLFIDAIGAASTGLDGIGGGLGGGARAGWAAAGRLRVELGLSARVGQVSPAQATATTVALAAGGAVALVTGRRVGLALRADARLGLQMASRFGAGGGSAAWESRWVPGGAAAVEGTVWLSTNTALLMAAGVEVDAGHTDVFVQDRKVAVIAASRAVGELGARMRF